MNPTAEQIETIKKMVKEFSLIDNQEDRMKKLKWYDLASGINNIEITEKIMKGIGAI